jgi:hypothetical protein
VLVMAPFEANVTILYCSRLFSLFTITGTPGLEVLEAKVVSPA